MPRPLAYGLVGPLAASLCFLLFVMVSTIAHTGDVAGVVAQGWRYATGAAWKGRLVLFAPAVVLGLAALPLHRRARHAETSASKTAWTAATLVLFALPHLGIGLIVLDPAMAIVAGFTSGLAALLVVRSLYPAAPASPIASVAPARPAAAYQAAPGSRSEFGLRRR
ncbi:hypothetical protein DMC25_13980 [Caulobacter sp. D4A]|uniref:hypothetical protein n=1 Tax=unclassified Caulobacter TaxID=2648921 RepID=UPI000D73CF84|nr:MULTISPECIES: hypothetical protein [unclassified Caulobacter]PXA86392.1 hypothetical protein DMC25_13980 [Caulobacter sp. D4A]PXA92357.1 hypothetical protein DMC18_11190 [Caulobacter sp. D5]